jgi:hypothetical protein
MTVRLELDPQSVEALAKEAAELAVPVEQLVAQIVRRHVLANGSPERTAAFRQALAATMTENEELLGRLAAEYVLAKNADLYRRLAK